MDEKQVGRGMVFVALIGIFLASSADGCSCVYEGRQFLQDLVCEANYVIQFTVTGETLHVDGQFGFGQRQYAISNVIEYKESAEYNAVADKNSLYTASNSAACGVTFNIGSTYVIGGYVSGGNLSIGLCSFLNREVSSLTVDQLRFLKYRLYRWGCSTCEIKYCEKPGECLFANLDRKACVGDRTEDKGSAFSCLDDHAFCAKSGWWFYRRCRWMGRQARGCRNL